jgi:hypothetical protein
VGGEEQSPHGAGGADAGLEAERPAGGDVERDDRPQRLDHVARDEKPLAELDHGTPDEVSADPHAPVLEAGLRRGVQEGENRNEGAERLHAVLPSSTLPG